MTLDRRRLLASAAALGAAAAAPPLAWSLPQGAPGAGPPKASVRPVTETLHGVTLTDPYRWMETPTDPEWTPYLTGQNAYARAVLARDPGARRAGGRRSRAVSGALAAISQVQSAGPYVFTQLRPVGANTFKLYVREGVGGQDRLLIDPDTLATAGTHYSLDYWAASPDGKLVAYGASAAGSENSALRFIETATGRYLPDTLDRAQFGPRSWSPDGAGVFINRLKAGTKHGDPDHYLDSVCWFHKVGDRPGERREGAGPGARPGRRRSPTSRSRSSSPRPAATSCSAWSPTACRTSSTIYASPLAAALAGKPVWRKVCARPTTSPASPWSGPTSTC